VIVLSDYAQGVVLPVRAQAGARANAIRGTHDGALKVSVTQVAEKGKANKAILQLLTKQLHLRRSQISLLGGETSTDKRFLIGEISRDELLRRINALLEPD
jgi:uncharacterized protein (TIGR00251 family)